MADQWGPEGLPGNDERRSTYGATWHPGSGPPPGPPGQPPHPGWQQPPADPRGFPAMVQRSHGAIKWWILGATSVLAVIAVTVALIATRPSEPEVITSDNAPGAGSTGDGDSSAPVAVPAQGPTALDPFVPSDRDLIATVGAAPGTEVKLVNGMYADIIVDQDCVGMLYMNEQAAFAGSGWSSTRAKTLRDVSSSDYANQHIAKVGLTVFPTVEQARAFFDKSQQTWKNCANRSVNERDVSSDSTDTQDQFWTVGPVVAEGDTIRSHRLQEGADGWGCESGLRVRSNVIAYASNCGGTPESQTSTALLDLAVKMIGS